MRTAARMALAWVFIRGGWDVLKNPDPRVNVAGGFIEDLRAIMPFVPEDKALLVKFNAGVMVGSGAVLALGISPLSRLAALALSASLVPTTLGGHAFWTHTEPGPRAQQVIHFNKNLALIGGLLFFALADK